MQGRNWLLAMMLGMVPLACAQAQGNDARQAAMQVQARYPGMIELNVDARDIDRRIQRVRERIPVSPGPPRRRSQVMHRLSGASLIPCSFSAE